MKPYFKESTGKLYLGNVLAVLKEMPGASVDMIMTSPPYFGLRTYGDEAKQIWGGSADCEHEWQTAKGKRNIGRDDVFCGGIVGAKQLSGVERKHPIDTAFCSKCHAWYGELGLEPDFNLYLQHLWQICDELWRVLKPWGTMWWNMGDTYSSQRWTGTGKGQPMNKFKDGYRDINPPRITGLKDKCLLMMPERFTLGLIERGWVLRNKIIWCLGSGTMLYVKSQKGVMPMAVKDLARLKPETVKLWTGQKWTQMVNIQKTISKEGNYQLTLRSGERISCTEGHQWPTERGLIKSKDLIRGDILENCVLPRMPHNAAFGLPPEKVGWFVGMYLAEGSRDSKQTIQIAGHKRESERFGRLKGIAGYYGGTCRKHEYGNEAIICLTGKILNAIIDTYIAGKTAHNKHLAVKCWQETNGFLHSLLAGYLQGDGHYDKKNNRWRIGFTRNKNLERDLRCLCARLGIGLRLNVAWSAIGKKRYPSYRGEIRYTLRQRRKPDTEIMKIEKAKARQYYEIAVADERHLFSLASGVLTHNSKPNPMPSSAKDRLNTCWEYLYYFAKSSQTQYWTNEKTLELVAKQPAGIKGVEGKDWEWRIVGQYDDDTFNVRVRDADKGKFLQGATEEERANYRKGKRKKYSFWQGHSTFFDLDAIREPHRCVNPEYVNYRPNKRLAFEQGERRIYKGKHKENPNAPGDSYATGGKNPGDVFRAKTADESQFKRGGMRQAPEPGEEGAFHPGGKNPGDFFSITTQPFPDAHFAVFPEALCEKPIKAGCPMEVCKQCGMPRERIMKSIKQEDDFKQVSGNEVHRLSIGGQRVTDKGTVPHYEPAHYQTTGFSKCSCNAGFRPGVLLDPFCGAGTALVKAKKLGRHYIGIDCVKDYLNMSRKRLVKITAVERGLF